MSESLLVPATGPQSGAKANRPFKVLKQVRPSRRSLGDWIRPRKPKSTESKSRGGPAEKSIGKILRVISIIALSFSLSLSIPFSACFDLYLFSRGSLVRYLFGGNPKNTAVSILSRHYSLGWSLERTWTKCIARISQHHQIAKEINNT